MAEEGYKIAALYRFVSLPNAAHTRDLLHTLTRELDICGGLILAAEGINGTVAGTSDRLDAFIAALLLMEPFTGMEVKYSHSDTQPFFRMRIQVKPEIIRMGCPVDPALPRGIDVPPAEWNALIGRADVVLLDTRNEYEVQLGGFEGARNPHTQRFSDFPHFVTQNLRPAAHTHVAMYCTGGIRCEKASAYMLGMGFEHVYQLQGGILKYLEEVAPESSMFKGECFVFDHRTAVAHGVVPGTSGMCFGCRHPLQSEDLLLESYREGVHCLHCIGRTSERRVAGREERQLQMGLSSQRGGRHLGYRPSRGAQQSRTSVVPPEESA